MIATCTHDRDVCPCRMLTSKLADAVLGDDENALARCVAEIERLVDGEESELMSQEDFLEVLRSIRFFVGGAAVRFFASRADQRAERG